MTPTPTNGSSPASHILCIIPVSHSLFCESFIGASDLSFNTFPDLHHLSVNKDRDSHPEITTARRWPLILPIAYSFSACLRTDNLVEMVCGLSGNVNTGQYYWRPSFFLRLLLSGLLYAQGSHYFSFIKTEVIIPLYSKTKKTLRNPSLWRRFRNSQFHYCQGPLYSMTCKSKNPLFSFSCPGE